MKNTKEDPFVLLDDCSASQEGAHSFLFDNPEHIIKADNLSQVSTALAKMDELLALGFHLAGWISYEVAATFEPRIKACTKLKAEEALIWMIATREPKPLTKDQVDNFLSSNCAETITIIPDDDIPPLSVFENKIKKIHEYINSGDVYQVNYTFNQPFHVNGSACGLYRILRQQQKVQYGALINSREIDILSLSPELFIHCKNGKLIARPMKGTAPRGADEVSDDANALAMQQDSKSRAENLMIVDLLRNDLSRIADPGSVKVPSLFEIEKYQTLLQMTSTIEATLSGSKKPSKILPALFPCGSVTGAPKIRAMEIIAELEDRPRGVYCGAIGHFAPNGDFTLNVPIRTATLRDKGKHGMRKGNMGIGSGIVADSIAKDEYDECLLKAHFLTEINPSCDLIETLKYSPKEGLLRLEKHLQRLTKSAATFHRPINKESIREKLLKLTKSSISTKRVRLTLSRNGTSQVSMMDLLSDITPPEQTICLAEQTTSSTDPMLCHKTSQRYLYDTTRIKAMKEHGVLDVIFCNEKGEVTEGAISNIFVEINGVLHTPPLSCGLLPGIMRQEIIDSARPTKEVVLRPEDIRKALNIYICNSVRGLVPVKLLSVPSVKITKHTN